MNLIKIVSGIKMLNIILFYTYTRTQVYKNIDFHKLLFKLIIIACFTIKNPRYLFGLKT